MHEQFEIFDPNLQRGLRKARHFLFGLKCAKIVENGSMHKIGSNQCGLENLENSYLKISSIFWIFAP